jgi:hypothetical protein
MMMLMTMMIMIIHTSMSIIHMRSINLLPSNSIP